MKATREFKPHKVACHTGQHGTLVRVCENCGASWYLKLREDHTYGWQPIVELYKDGSPVEADIDVTYCYAQDTTPTSTAPVQSAPRTDERKCYCSDCYKAGRKEHYPGDERCYCVKCRGQKAHKIGG